MLREFPSIDVTPFGCCFYAWFWFFFFVEENVTYRCKFKNFGAAFLVFTGKWKSSHQILPLSTLSTPTLSFFLCLSSFPHGLLCTGAPAVVTVRWHFRCNFLLLWCRVSTNTSVARAELVLKKVSWENFVHLVFLCLEAVLWIVLTLFSSHTMPFHPFSFLAALMESYVQKVVRVITGISFGGGGSDHLCLGALPCALEAKSTPLRRSLVGDQCIRSILECSVAIIRYYNLKGKQ